MQLLPPRAPHGVYNGSTGRRSDAIGATATRPGCGERSGARPGPAAIAAGGARGRAAGGEATLGLERRQRAGLRGRRPAFLKRLHGDGPRAHDGQQRPSPHRQGEMPIPADPAAHFIVIQADFPLGRLHTARDGPAGPGHPHHLVQRGRCRREDHVGPQLGGRTHTGAAPTASGARVAPQARPGPASTSHTTGAPWRRRPPCVASTPPQARRPASC